MNQPRMVKAYTRESIEPPRATARLYVKSSGSMDEVPDESVTLTVTSPPYWNAIDYDRHAGDPGDAYRTRRYSGGFDDYNSYLNWVSGIFVEVLRKTRPGGYLAVVVGTVLMDGASYPVPFDLVTRVAAAGWDFHQDIIWHKSTGGVKRAGVFIQHPYPGYYRPNIMTEYILIFRKPGEPIYRGPSPEGRESARYQVGALFTKEVANNVWHIAPVPPGMLQHPCPFPEEIPYRLVQLYSYPGDTILDPFLGSGQTAKVAFALGRNVVGYDVVEKYAEYSYKRLDEPLSVRSAQLVAEFSHVPLDAPLGYGGRATGVKTRHGSGLASRRKSPGPVFDFVPMTREYADEIVGWHYPGVYSFYDLDADEEDKREFLDPSSWSTTFAVLDDQRALVGFFSYTGYSEGIEIGLGLRPDLTGMRLGESFVRAGLAFLRSKVNPARVTLKVAEFNARAIKVYEKLGFREVSRFIQKTNGGDYRFVEMAFAVSR